MCHYYQCYYYSLLKNTLSKKEKQKCEFSKMSLLLKHSRVVYTWLVGAYQSISKQAFFPRSYIQSIQSTIISEFLASRNPIGLANSSAGDRRQPFYFLCISFYYCSMIWDSAAPNSKSFIKIHELLLFTTRAWIYDCTLKTKTI